MDYNNFLKFYEDHRNELLLTDGLRPAKSVTRTIFTSVEKFVDWYKKTGKTFITFDDVANEICNLTSTGRSTIEDNIRNMIEIQFLIKLDQQKYQFTRNFIDYIYSNMTLSEYLIDKMSKIDSLDNINMFYNYILCTLREGLIKGKITLYPDSVEEFKRTVIDKTKRIEILNEVYNIYGFKGRNSEPNKDDYTPNINYRIISTIKNLNLIEESSRDKYGFNTYTLTQKSYELLKKIDDNIKYLNFTSDRIQEDNNKSENNIENDSIVKEGSNLKNDGDIYSDLLDELYNLEVNSVQPESIQNILLLDYPQPVANQYATRSVRRDPIKAANARKAAEYKCEFDNNHVTFICKATNRNYVEAHHLVPMELQSKFLYSLDVESNIVALCPICHRMIHHATEEEKKDIIVKLYKERIERLKKCNIYIELDDLISFYSK